MKKTLIVINGTMGVGKTAVSRELHGILQPSVMLDGDWCWDINPFAASEENKKMALDNIAFLLDSFLANSSLRYVIFCWVIHLPEIYGEIFGRMKARDYELRRFTLTCSEAALRARLARDVSRGARAGDIIERSVQRLPLYDRMDTVKIDVGRISARQAAEQIARAAAEDPASVL